MEWNRRLSTQLSGDDGPGVVSVGILVLLGLCLLAHPLYLWPQYGQTPYSVLNVEPVAGETPPADAVIEYGTLPAEAREAFDASRRDEFRTLWSGEDDRAIRVLESHRFVRYEGTYYEYSFSHGDVMDVFAGPVRGLLTAGGAFLIVFGGFALGSGTWRPFTPFRSLWVPVLVTLGIVGTQAYDVLYSGIGGSLPLPNTLVSFVPVAASFVGVGSVARLRGERSLLPVAGFGVLLLGSGAIITGAPPVVPLVLGVVLTVGGAPWAALGYWLTSSEQAPNRLRL